MKTDKSRGFILPIILITGFLIVLMIVAVSSESLNSKNTSAHYHLAAEAQMTADAGLDSSLNQLNTGGTGAISEKTLLDDPSQNIKTTYQVDVTDVDPTHKTLAVTAKVYSPDTATTAKVIRKYQMDIEAVTSETFSSAVASGVGGLVINSNAKVTGGDVIVNGKITMSNNAQIGLSTNPVKVRVADETCPADHGSGYPRVCSTDDGDTITDPITMGRNAKIYADVIATNQTNGDNMSDTGLEVGRSFAPFSLPPFDRDGFKSTITTSMSSTDAESCPDGSVTWPAGVHITGGNVVTPNNCTVKVNGNVWIDGSLTLRNNARLVVQDAVGSTRPDIVVDGSGGVNISNNGTVTPNSSGTGVEIVTFWSADSSCSPDCTDLSGTELYNSQITPTITLSNNGAAPASILYAYWTEADISNNGSLGAVAGQTVELSQNAIINFTSSISGGSNEITSWVKRGYMRLYN
ncbi:MAG TPA: hypothetical protein VFW90_04360 [Candidatus Saccharimonadales bacterium]|nr:hypothetical protein [Candidatus Saccharimonadales bacterium]